MLKIAICDDEAVFAQYLKQIVSQFMEDKSVQHEIQLFDSGEAFVQLDMDMANYHVVFLDVNMEELDGISTAKRLRELSKDTIVVFVTAFINYAVAGYEVEAIRYILKNTSNFEKSVYECMEAILEKKCCDEDIHKFSFKEGIETVSEADIVYIESNLHEVRFYMPKWDLEMYRLDDTLNHIESILGSSKFVRIHQSYLVNMKYIRNIKGQKAILINGTELPIAKQRYKKVRSLFVNYKGAI